MVFISKPTHCHGYPGLPEGWPPDWPPDTPFQYRNSPSCKNSVDIGLAVETGMRYYALKNVSLDASFKYRWAQPTYRNNVSAHLEDDWVPGPVNVTLKPTYRLFSVQVGAAYHF